MAMMKRATMTSMMMQVIRRLVHQLMIPASFAAHFVWQITIVRMIISITMRMMVVLQTAMMKKMIQVVPKIIRSIKIKIILI